MSIILRPYQVEAIESTFSEIQNGLKSGLICLATGMGKTTVAGKIMEQFPARTGTAGRTLWLTHREDLIEQSAKSVMCTLYPDYAKRIKSTLHDSEGILSFMRSSNVSRDLFDKKVNLDFQVDSLIKNNLGIIKAQLFNIQPRLVVGSIQTVINRLDRIPPDWFDLIIVDEAHQAMAKSWKTTLEYFKPKFLAGLTATPERADGLSLGDLFDKVIIERDLKYGIDNKYLCEIEAILIETNIDLSSIGKRIGDFNTSDLSNVVDTPVRNLKIVRKWQEYGKGRQTMAFCVDVKHAMNLCEEFQNCGENWTFIVGDKNLCPNRSQRIRDFLSGKYDGVCVVDLLTIGFDHPDIGATISAAPTMSRTKFMQGPVGRGTRLKTQAFIDRVGKGNLLLFDVTDNSKRHQVVNTTTLDAGKRFEDKVFIGEERKRDLIAQRDARKLKHVQEVEETFSLLALPKLAVRMDAPWMKDAATDAQLRLIARHGYDIVNTTYTKGHCNQIISNLDCTAKDLRFLQENGFDVSNGATFGQLEIAKKMVLQKNTTREFSKTIGSKNPFSGIN